MTPRLAYAVTDRRPLSRSYPNTSNTSLVNP
jgi:hypothetical protein